MDGLPFGTCDGTVIVPLERFIDGAVVGKFGGLLLIALIVSVVVIVLGFNRVIVLVFLGGKFFGRTLGDMVGL